MDTTRTGALLPLVERRCTSGHVNAAASKTTLCRECGAPLLESPSFDDALAAARSVLLEFKALHAGTAAIAAAGRIVREIEALR